MKPLSTQSNNPRGVSWRAKEFTRKKARSRLERFAKLELPPKWQGIDLDNHIHNIFSAARTFASKSFMDSHPGTFVFVGLGMRPLYESVIGVLGIRGINHRKRFKFITIPSEVSPLSSKFNLKSTPRLLNSLKKIMRRDSNFWVVDFSTLDYAGAINAFLKLVRDTKPGAVVGVINHKDKFVGEGIAGAEMLPRPVHKNPSTGQFINEPKDSLFINPKARQISVYFQSRLAEFLKSQK